jgi:lipopolysaccharide transport system ATP-binding protein
MTKSEVKRKFDDIVDFSSIEKFIDVPVKWYSSGMYLRLAFSVSAHLEPEILILDEVLAVGDAEFQNKSLKKMREITGDGTTILFVSHNVDAVSKLCERALLFSSGRIVADGPAKEIGKAYLGGELKLSPERCWDQLAQAPGDEVVRLIGIRARNEQGGVSAHFDIRKPLGIEMEFEVLQAGHVLKPSLHFSNEQRINLFISGDRDRSAAAARVPGRYTTTAWIPGNFLAAGNLIVSAALATPEPELIHFWEQEVIIVEIIDSFEADSVRGNYRGWFPGVVRPKLSWTTNHSPALAQLPSGQHAV